jgi:outer membrane protein TolC
MTEATVSLILLPGRPRAPSQRATRFLALCTLCLALAPGCATEPTSPSNQTAYPQTTSRADAKHQDARPAADAVIRTKAESPSPGSAEDQPAAAGPALSDRDVPVPAPPVIPPPAGEYPIDLATALRLADVSNPTIAVARTQILEALALQLTARTLLVPSLNSGVSYHGHNGVLQRSSGKILSLSEQSLYIGAGARTVAAESVSIPGVTIWTPLTDAWFEPLAARQRVFGAQFNAQSTSNEILLDVALLHLQLLGNQSILEAQRRSEFQIHQVVTITGDYAEIGQGRDSDAHRARSQWQRRRALVLKAEEELAVTAARLANRLNLDTSVRLEPVGGPLVPLDLVDLDTPQPELIQVALRERPDIGARTAAIGEAEAHFKEEINRPLLPTIWLGFSGGVFGGGSNLVPPLVGNFGGRTDFDVRVYWTLLNLGAGNLSLIRNRQAEIGQATAERARTINRARDEVSASLADAQAAKNQIDIARRELESAELGFSQDLERSRQNLGRPIEVLNSLTLLADARVNLIRALVHYDQAQFKLWVSLGSPPPLGTPETPLRPTTG